MSKIIILNGAPGSGKTTLLKRLANDLQVGYITKDQFKELLGDSLGIPTDYATSASYGMIASVAIFDVMETLTNGDLTYIVESAFWADIANERFSNMTNDSNVYMQVYVTCDHKVRTQRFAERISNNERHSVHWDGTYADASEEDINRKYKPIEFAGLKTIFYDATNPKDEDYTALINDIQKWRDM
jgi:cytidylate kinase